MRRHYCWVTDSSHRPADASERPAVESCPVESNYVCKLSALLFYMIENELLRDNVGLIMSVLSESRREFFGQVAGVGLLSSLAGCTMVGTVDVDIIIENTGLQEEQMEYYIDRGEKTTETRAINLESGDEQTVSAELERTDVVVVSKGDFGYECELVDLICRKPTLSVGIGWESLSITGECFYLRDQ